jgi:hypothetical protein
MFSGGRRRVIVRISTSSLRDGSAYEYLVRFVLGGAATVLTGIISDWFGPFIGGLFLALPAIFCASATLIERHEARRKHRAGLHGQRRGQQAAALDAAGAALGSIGMLAFAIAFSLLAERNAIAAFVTALAAWCLVSIGTWWVWRHWRTTRPGRVEKSGSLPRGPFPRAG